MNEKLKALFSLMPDGGMEIKEQVLSDLLALEELQEIREWAEKELEPYFQGEYGTMDTMLEMFLEQLDEKYKAAISAYMEGQD